jgi:hypothetical protein
LAPIIKGGKKMDGDESVKQALKKCAVGFDTSEVVEEFTVDNGNLVLVKKKVTRRDIPPDIKAVKMLLDEAPAVELSDEQLEAERKNLMQRLKEENFD